MKLSKDEVFEWACEIANKYGCHPLRPLGMLDTYAVIYGYEGAMKKIKEKLEGEANGN